MAPVQRRSERGWHQPDDLTALGSLYELDAEPLAGCCMGNLRRAALGTLVSGGFYRRLISRLKGRSACTRPRPCGRGACRRQPRGSPRTRVVPLLDFLFVFAIGVVSPLGRTPIQAGPKHLRHGEARARDILEHAVHAVSEHASQAYA